nr:hypothetical protein [Winogradskyella sp. DF17]
MPSLLFFGFVYLKYNEDLPQGETGAKADALAQTMLTALDESAYLNTDYIEWTFKGMHSYKWYKSTKECEVSWDQLTVVLDLEDSTNSKVFVAGQNYDGIEKDLYIKKATDYFNNDSFWLVAPYKVFDKGTERRLVKTEAGKDALLVTYTSGGSTPGDSYLWHLNDHGRPKSFQMWVSILPIGGVEATWEDWIITESGTQLPTFHKLLFFGIEMSGVKGLNL